MLYFSTLIFALTFFAALYFRRRRMAAERRRQLVQTWPRAVAAFTGPVPRPRSEGEDDSSKPEPPPTQYVYSVQGKRYVGSYLSPAKETITSSTNDRALYRLGDSGRWRIYYNPENPAEAYLSPGPPQLWNLHLIIDFFFLFFVPAVMIFSWYGVIMHN